MPSFVLEHAQELADRPALIDGSNGRSLTYAQLDEAARSFATGLQAKRQGRMAEAESWLRAATSRQGDFLYLAWIELGELQLLRGQRQEARTSFETARDLAAGKRFAGGHQATIERRLQQLGSRR